MLQSSSIQERLTFSQSKISELLTLATRYGLILTLTHKLWVIKYKLLNVLFKLNCFFSKSDLVSPLLKSVSMVKIAMHRIRQWYWVRKNFTYGWHYQQILYIALFRNWLKSLWLEPSAQGDYIRLRFWKNAYAKSDGNKLYILNRFRSGMRCEENQMIKDSR